MNNDTPRTNANAVWPASNDDSDRESPDGSHVPVDFARELERENTRLREALTNCARTLRTHREYGVSITGTEDGDIEAAESFLLPNPMMSGPEDSANPSSGPRDKL